LSLRFSLFYVLETIVEGSSKRQQTSLQVLLLVEKSVAMSWQKRVAGTEPSYVSLFVMCICKLSFHCCSESCILQERTKYWYDHAAGFMINSSSLDADMVVLVRFGCGNSSAASTVALVSAPADTIVIDTTPFLAA
jgi:hypothetical protein